MRLHITLVALLLSSCTSLGVHFGPLPAEVTADKSGSQTLNVKIRNRSSRPLEYAWPIAMASADRSPIECPLPTADFAYETYVLAPNDTKQLQLGGWKRTGYVGVWVREQGGAEWIIAWSRNQLP
jgi:hypothetical protein